MRLCECPACVRDASEETASDVSRDIRIAYCLLVHKNPEQVNLFIKQLLVDPGADVYVHVDAKQRDALIDRILNHSRVHILSQSVAASWGDISLVDATLLLFRAVLRSAEPYDFVCLRSGQDLVVKSGYKEYLTQHKGENFIALRKIAPGTIGAAFLDVRWPRCTRRLYDGMHPYRVLRALMTRLYAMGINVRPNVRRVPATYGLYDGSQWFSFSGHLVRSIIAYLDNHRWYYEAFEDVLVPDTSFFQILIMNSPFASTVVNDYHMYVQWGSTLRNVNHPMTLTSADIPSIEGAGKFFARKFDEGVDRSVIQYFADKVCDAR